MSLIEELKKYIPFEVSLNKEVVKYLKTEKKLKIDNQILKVVDVYDAESFGGIICVIPNKGEEALVISITHIKINKEHPLSELIQRYQKERIEWLQSQGG